MAGFPDTTSAASINRLCSSGLEAIATAADKIRANSIQIAIAGGVESMSQYEMMNMIEVDKINDAVFEHAQARNCLMGMGETSENVAAAYKIPREKQDQMAVDSHLKAAQAQKSGRFDEEIVRFKTKVVDKDGNEREVMVEKDDGIRQGVTLESLGKLKPAFKKDGSTTAGNASQVTDGAALSLLMKRGTAKALKLKVQAVFRAYSVVGVPPEIMGVGPAFAIPKVLEKVNLKISDIDVFEINEAFAS